MDPESVNQIVKAIMSLHDGRTLKPEAIVSAFAALVAASAAVVTYKLGKTQIEAARANAETQIASAQKIAQDQIKAAEENARRQIESAQTVAKQQVESAHEVARLNLIMPMREVWIGQLREKLSSYLTRCAMINILKPKEHSADTWGLLSVRYEIGLMLNPDDESHQKLYDAMKKNFDLAADAEMGDPAVGKAVDETTRLAHVVLAAEWKRAKVGQS